MVTRYAFMGMCSETLRRFHLPAHLSIGFILVFMPYIIFRLQIKFVTYLGFGNHKRVFLYIVQ